MKSTISPLHPSLPRLTISGKTNDGTILFGCSIHHKDVRLCCTGSTSLYLAYCFHVTKKSQSSNGKTGSKTRNGLVSKFLSIYANATLYLTKKSRTRHTLRWSNQSFIFPTSLVVIGSTSEGLFVPRFLNLWRSMLKKSVNLATGTSPFKKQYRA